MSKARGLSEHWDERYRKIGSTDVSWFQAEPLMSIRLIGSLDLLLTDPIVDVGGGASLLVDRLCELGFADLTVVDLSVQALEESKARVGNSGIEWIAADVRQWQPKRQFVLWHDRATFHFLTEVSDQHRYWDIASGHLTPGGHVVIGVFAHDGPQTCSGLPVRRYDIEELAAVMGPSFAILEHEYESHVTPAGASQAFLWVVAQRLGESK
ncbi:MAG: class I SAM-dependent methyltransferase [Actinomycetota bacterium]|nr:class I SAM-dependent methyltransferase [Actinomycetota bacterium]